MDYNGAIQVTILIIFCVMAVRASRERISARNGWVPLAFGILITITIDAVLYIFHVFADRPLLWFGIILLAGTLISIYLIGRPFIIIKPKE